MTAVLSAVEVSRKLGLGYPPTDEQAAVIEAPLGPGVVIAGAGSGKTETMAARVVWLIANQLIDPAAVLGLTFTRKAAAELGQRVRRRLTQWRHVVERERPDDREHLAMLMAGEPTVLTYSAYAGRLVAEHAMRVGAEPSPRLLSQAVRWQLADAVVRRYPNDLPVGIGKLASVVGYLLSLSDQLADHLVTPDDVEQFCLGLLRDLEPFGALPPSSDDGRLRASTENRAALVPLLGDFAAAKRGAVDFGDVMSIAAALAAVPDVAQIERERFGAVLLDEYQDTGHAQIHLLGRLFGDGHAVTAVGDPFQSIYGWRGASSGNIGRFASTFAQPDGRVAPVFRLATSWRNDAVILQVANLIAAPLAGAATVELAPRPKARPGRVAAALTQTVDDEARWVAERMGREWQGRPSGARTAAVLVRRRAQIPLLHKALLTAGLPVEVVGLGGLLTTPEVSDVVATLRVLADQGSGPAIARLLTGARWRIGAHDLAVLSARAVRLAASRSAVATDSVAADAVTMPEDPVDRGSLVEALDDLGAPGAYSAEGFRRLQACGNELRLLRRRLSAPLPELIADIERHSGIDIEVAARADRSEVGRAHLDRFLDEAARFSADADEATLGAFLAFLDAAEQEENGLEAGEAVVETERVQILTVHGAKGLEWDVVAIPGLVERVFPTDPQGVDWTRTRQLLPTALRGDRADLPTFTAAGAADRKQLRARLAQHSEQVKARHADEERRLAYVAVTRARETLLVSGYVWDSATRPRVVSPFLDEVRGLAEVDEWYVAEPDATNPLDDQVHSAEWPDDPLGDRRADVETGAELVRAAIEAARTAHAPAAALPTARRSRRPTVRPGDAVQPLPGLVDDTLTRAAAWHRDVDLLLTERAELARSGTVEVALPSRLSVSQLVALHRDPDQLARRLRRPLPNRPAPLARRGTAFHSWLEQRWSAQTLLDVDELPGAADEAADDADFLALREAFEASAWAARTPAEVEVPFEMAIGGAVVRGRMDAVFGTAEQWTVVDWKTGARPRGAEAAAAAVQLAAYRLAWARLNEIPDDQLGRVKAAFHYVRSDETVSPVDLLDAEGLRRLIAGPGDGAPDASR